MSELKNPQSRSIRHDLLVSASTWALVGVISVSAARASADADRPTVWIELGGNFERVDSSQEIFSPPFFNNASPDILVPMVRAQILPHFSIGGEGKVTFEPEDSDWVFSASVRYGRSNAERHLHKQTNHAIVPIKVRGGVVTSAGSTKYAFGDGQARLGATHAIADFTAGKDVGLGMFGSGASSVFSAGIRFAQFTSNTDGSLHARPIYGSLPPFTTGSIYIHSRFFHNNTATFAARRSTQIFGPTVSWDASIPLTRNDTGMRVALDWGANAAALFGRQRARIHHDTNGYYFKGVLTYAKYKKNYTAPPVDHVRSRFVTVPNIGGFAGLTFAYADAKLAFGYRADFFFNAIDSGIDTAKRENIGFYGPFASVSVGIGG